MNSSSISIHVQQITWHDNDNSGNYHSSTAVVVAAAVVAVVVVDDDDDDDDDDYDNEDGDGFVGDDDALTISEGLFSNSYFELSALASHLVSSSNSSDLWSFLSLIH